MSVRQCHYCNHFFAKSEDRMKHHISVCSAKEGIIYSFDNAQIIDYQDNYKYMGEVPFTVYFDFELLEMQFFFIQKCLLSVIV